MLGVNTCVSALVPCACCCRLNEFVFSDLTDSSSFQRARFWVKELQNCEEVSEQVLYVVIDHILKCETLKVVFFCHLLIMDQDFTLHKVRCKILFVVLQQCKIYLCGTKNDLITADRSLRQIDYHDAQDFAEGIYSVYWSLY